MKKNTFVLKTSPLIAAIAVANSAMASVCSETYTVTKITDDTNDQNTLHGAIHHINNNCLGQETRITISDTIAGQTINMSESYIQASSNALITIEGPTDNPVTTQSTANGEGHFSVNGTTALTIKNLIMNGADHGAHAVVVNEGSSNAVTIENSVLKNFHAGAIRANSIRLTIKDSQLSSNQVSASGINGGAIYLTNSDVSIDGSSFDNNQSTGSGSSNGGAIYVDTVSQLTVNDSTFKGNTATGSAGAIYSQGDVEINQSTFKDNTAQTYGGALYLQHNSGADPLEVDIVDSVFDSNRASNDEIGNGGAIYVSSSESGPSNVRIDRSLFDANHAHSSGAALYVADSSSQKAKITLSNSTIANNTGGTNAGITFSGGYADGSKISHTTIVNNTASLSSGGSAIYGNGLTTGSDLEISHTIISGNTGGYAQVCNYNEANHNFSYKNSFVSNDTASSVSCLANTSDVSSQVGSDTNVLDPMLNELADNGGSSESYYPKFGSPIIDAGDTNIENAPEKDQRGNDRIMRGVIDIGAVEYGNLAPAFDTSVESVTIEEEQSIQFDVSNHVSDPEGDTLTYSASGLPSGVSIDSTSGIVSGTPTETGTFNVTLTVTDAYNANSQASTTIAVTAKPQPQSEEDAPDNSSSGSGTLGYSWLGGLLLFVRRRR